MVETDFVVCACVLLGRRADEAVVDEELVVRVGAVCCQDFFADLCCSSVLVSQAGLLCSPVLLILRASSLLMSSIEKNTNQEKRPSLTIIPLSNNLIPFTVL